MKWRDINNTVVLVERWKNTLMPSFLLHVLWVVGLRRKIQCALRGVEETWAPGIMFYEHSDPNETPGWESGRHESGNSKAWLVLQGEQLTSDYLWTWHLWTGQDHLASSPTIYPVAQQTRGRQAKNKLFSVSVSHTLMRLRAMQRRDCMFEFTYDCYREIKSQIWIIAGILIMTLLSTIADWCR